MKIDRQNERIRKALLKMVRDTPNAECEKIYNVSKEDTIAWLENQGKIAAAYEDRLDRCACECFNKGYKTAIEHQKEKQGEKSDNNVKPKFKVGDWIVSDYDNVVYIDFITEKNYHLQLKNGYHEVMSINYVDKNWHLWTIQDAKDGDVLASNLERGYDSPFIAIYKERGLDFFNSYCFIGLDGKFYKGDTGHDIIGIHPSTKEQRNLLFQKMKESGYEWDAEKKELRKK